MNYTISKPETPIAVHALGFVVVVGLIALFIAAFFAFNEVMPWYQALFAAVLIEAGAIVEALAFASDRNWIAAGGLALSLTVSGTYNYIQAQQAGAGVIESWWQLLTLAIGPLSALTFLSLALGSELKKHRENVNAWEQNKQAWIEKETKRIERRQDRQRRRRVVATSQDVTGLSAITDYRKLPEEILPELADMSPLQIQHKFPLIASRTARIWKQRASVRSSPGNGNTEASEIGGGEKL